MIFNKHLVISSLLGSLICTFLAGCAELERVNLTDAELQAVRSGSSASTASSVKNPCPDCGKSLAYADEYKLWFCEKEGKYMAEGYDPAKAAKKLPPPVKKFPTPPSAVKKFPTPPSKQPVVKDPCPDCGKSMAYADEYKLWFCESEQKYMPEGFTPSNGPASAAPAVPVAAAPVAVPAPATAKPSPASSGEGVVVFGFETAEGTEASERQDCEYTLSNTNVTQGNSCFKVTLGDSPYPGFAIFEYENNSYAGYKYLAVDVYNPGKQLKNFAFLVDNDRNEENGRYTLDDTIIRPGANTIKLDLSRVRTKLKEGAEEISLIVLFLDKSSDPNLQYPVTLYYDNLRLMK